MWGPPRIQLLDGLAGIATCIKIRHGDGTGQESNMARRRYSTSSVSVGADVRALPIGHKIRFLVFQSCITVVV